MELLFEKFIYYQNLQKNIIKEILLFFNCPNIENLDEEDLWSFDQITKSGWEITPHGEHLNCKSIDLIRIQIPLYIDNYIGIDPGHFYDFLNSINVTGYDYQLIANKLIKLEAQKKAKSIHVESMSAVWKVSSQ